jgi:hypothetical protein
LIYIFPYLCSEYDFFIEKIFYHNVTLICSKIPTKITLGEATF